MTGNHIICGVTYWPCCFREIAQFLLETQSNHDGGLSVECNQFKIKASGGFHSIRSTTEAEPMIF